MRTVTLLLCGSMLATALPLAAQEPRSPADGAVIQGQATNDTLQAEYLNASPFYGNSSDLDYGLLFSNAHNFVGSAAWMYKSNLDLVPHLHFDFGPKAYIASLAEQNRGILSLSVGGDVLLDVIPSLGVQVFGSAFYAPSIFMFGSADNLYDLTAGVQVRFAPRFMAQAGYRWFRYILENSADDTVQNNLFVGVRYDLH